MASSSSHSFAENNHFSASDTPDLLKYEGQDASRQFSDQAFSLMRQDQASPWYSSIRGDAQQTGFLNLTDPFSSNQLLDSSSSGPAPTFGTKQDVGSQSAADLGAGSLANNSFAQVAQLEGSIFTQDLDTAITDLINGNSAGAQTSLNQAEYWANRFMQDLKSSGLGLTGAPGDTGAPQGAPAGCGDGNPPASNPSYLLAMSPGSKLMSAVRF